MKNKDIKNTDFVMQPILFNREQYEELIRAFSVYSLIKGPVEATRSETGKIFEYIVNQSEKFGFKMANMDAPDWVDEVSEKAYDDLYDYTEESVLMHLAGLLADRDVQNEIEETTGLSKEELPAKTFSDSIIKRAEAYLNEFHKNGFNNLVCTSLPEKFFKIKELK